MNANEKIRFAKERHADIWKCGASCFDSSENVFIETEDTFFEMITFGGNAVVRGDEKIIGWCRENFGDVPARRLMDWHLYSIEAKLREYGKKLSGEHVGYLHFYPEIRAEKPAGLTCEWYRDDEIPGLYQFKEFDNAFSFDGKHDRLALAARDGERIVGMSGCDDYMGDLWQIGIDVLPEYRHLKLGSYLVKELALEIERGGKQAYYNTWSPNLASTRLALGMGFRPVWVGYPSEECNANNQ